MRLWHALLQERLLAFGCVVLVIGFFLFNFRVVGHPSDEDRRHVKQDAACETCRPNPQFLPELLVSTESDPAAMARAAIGEVP